MSLVKEVTQVISASEKESKLVELAKANYNPISNGLGLPAGKYTFVTENSEDIFAVRPITAKPKGNETEGRKYALTMVAGVMTGDDEKTAGLRKVFGLKDTDAQLVVTADQWAIIQPNASYTVVIGENGRVASVTAKSSNSNLVEETPEQKQAREFAAYQAAQAKA